MTLLDTVAEWRHHRRGLIRPLTRRNLKAWSSARTLADLGELTALWLEGRIRQLPSYGSAVDVDESQAPGLTAALVAWNRAGFVTHVSQAGCDGWGQGRQSETWWTQYAAVAGFADQETLLRLFDAVEGTRFGIRYWEVAPPGADPEETPDEDLLYVTFKDGGWAVTSFGRCDVDDVVLMYDGCHPDAIRAVLGAWQVTVFDPEEGANDLWAVLHKAALDL